MDNATEKHVRGAEAYTRARARACTRRERDGDGAGSERGTTGGSSSSSTGGTRRSFPYFHLSSDRAFTAFKSSPRIPVFAALVVASSSSSPPPAPPPPPLPPSSSFLLSFSPIPLPRRYKTLLSLSLAHALSFIYLSIGHGMRDTGRARRNTRYMRLDRPILVLSPGHVTVPLSRSSMFWFSTTVNTHSHRPYPWPN